jgi:hypothetical protein
MYTYRGPAIHAKLNVSEQNFWYRSEPEPKKLQELVTCAGIRYRSYKCQCLMKIVNCRPKDEYQDVFRCKGFDYYGPPVTCKYKKVE